MEFEDTGESNFTILFNKVIEDKNFLPTTRLLAVDISKNGYVNIGDFFQNIPDQDLKKYMNMAEDIESDSAAEILLLAEMLAIGEGLDNGLNETEPETMQNRMSQLIVFLASESLSRQGLIELYRKNMSFGDDMKDKILMKRLF